MALVLFSGGCDSTLVLHDLLKANDKNYISQITALSINHCQVSANEQNKAARESFKEEMGKRELNLHVNFCEIAITNTCSANVNSIGSYGLSQPIIWSTIAMLYASNEDTIYFGYHSGDDFWLYKNEFEAAIQNICKISAKTIKIEYPLRHLYKHDIIRILKERGLYEKTWYCEYPTVENKPCGECVPCRTHRTALWYLETFGNRLPRVDDYHVSTLPGLPLPSQDLNMDIAQAVIKEVAVVNDWEANGKKECAMLQGT